MLIPANGDPFISCPTPSLPTQVQPPARRTLPSNADSCLPNQRIPLTETPSVTRVARPKKPEGALVTVATRVTEATRDELDRMASDEGMTRSALLARILARAVEHYPADD